MGLWTDQAVPRMGDRALDAPELRSLRDRVCAGLAGEVVEIGFGGGLNVPHYPPAVTRVDAVEPSDVSWRLAGRRLAAAAVPVHRSGRDGQAMTFPDHSVDAALSTFSLCTIPDAVAALRDVRRIVRPGGALPFAEHGLAPDESVRRWQRRLDPLNSRLQGGCHIVRPIDQLLASAGFVVERMDRYYLPKAPRPFAHVYEGLARA